MTKYVNIGISLTIQEDEPQYIDHYVLAEDTQVSALLNVLNDAATAVVRQLPGAALVFDTNWSGLKWAVDRPTDHTAKEEPADHGEVVS